MAKRNPRSRRPAGRTCSRPARREPPRDEPDRLARITDTLGNHDPLPLLALASTLPAVTDPRGRSPLAGPSDGPNRDQLIESFLGVLLPETSVLLGALAGLPGDDVLSRRAHREIARRAHPLPTFLSALARATGEPRAFELVHTLDDVVEHLTVADGSDPGTTARPLGPADARAQIGAAVELGTAHFGVGNGAISQRSEPILRAIGVEPQQPYRRKNLGAPRYPAGTRRSAVLADRDRYRARAGAR